MLEQSNLAFYQVVAKQQERTTSIHSKSTVMRHTSHMRRIVLKRVVTLTNTFPPVTTRVNITSST